MPRKPKPWGKDPSELLIRPYVDDPTISKDPWLTFTTSRRLGDMRCSPDELKAVSEAVEAVLAWLEWCESRNRAPREHYPGKTAWTIIGETGAPMSRQVTMLSVVIQSCKELGVTFEDPKLKARLERKNAG